MTKYPLVSIITATYQKFDHLWQTIRSVLEQDYPYIEYIIADDGSENFPAKEIAAYVRKHKRQNIVSFRILRNAQNVGTVRNLNRAARASKGDYVMMLSCNDIFCRRNVVSRVVQRFRTTDADLIAASRVPYDLNGRKRCLLPHYLERGIIKSKKKPLEQYRLYVWGSLMDMVSGCVLYYSRRILEQYGYFDESYRLLEDAPFAEKYLWEHTLCTAYDIVAIYHQDGGVSSGKSQHTQGVYAKDEERFWSWQRCRHFDELDSRTQRMLTYTSRIRKAINRRQKAALYLKYADIALPKACFRVFREANSLLEYRIIRMFKL